jgi:hypothetical protein
LVSQDSILTAFHLTSTAMTDELEKRRSDMGWGIPASILLHVVFAFVLFFHLPLDFSEPQKEESVNVEIVPPPEEPEKKAEEQPKAAEEPQPEEVKKEEVPPPPPEPPKQEEAKKEEPPPPEPEQKPEEQPPANEQARGQPIPVLRPVFEFGEKDAGPRKAGDGDSPEEGAAMSPPETEPDTKPAELPKSPAKEPPETEAAEVSKPATAQQEPAEAPPANPVPDEIQVPEVDVTAANSEQDGPISQAAPADTTMAIVAAQPVSPRTEPVPMPPVEKPAELTEAKRLFSQNQTGDLSAIAAMGNIPRGDRVGQLCATELTAQLQNASPPYQPDRIRPYRLRIGSVLEVKRSDFRAGGQWYDLSFRCEVNDDATKVLSFAFKVGAPVPRSEWRKRGFPAF